MVKLKKINKGGPLIEKCAYLVQKYSWGLDYPVKAISEFKRADFIVAALENKELVGCASINRVASPDQIDNGKLWFADAIVLPKYRRLGIFGKMYQKCLAYMKKRREPVFACTNNLIVVSFLLQNGWRYHRSTKDESGGLCLVFRLD